jgi:hypothetical protein
MFPNPNRPNGHSTTVGRQNRSQPVQTIAQPGPSHSIHTDPKQPKFVSIPPV